MHLKVVTSSGSLHLKLQTVGPLTQNAFANKANDNWGTVSRLQCPNRPMTFQ